MTKLTIYEEKTGKEDMELSNYFRLDYVRRRILMNFIGVTIGYVLLLGLYVVYNMEYYVQHAVTLDYWTMGKTALGIYLIILVVYIFAAIIYAVLHYNASRKRLSKYFRMLRALRDMYKEEQEETEEKA